MEKRNILPEKPPPGELVLVLRQLKNPLIYVLILAAGVTVVIGHWSDAAIILAAVGVNTVLGYIQESRATKALAALRRYVTSRAIVVRGGKRREINAEDIKVGDEVILAAGSRIPADGALIFANRLVVEEAALTGESQAVNKIEGNEVYMGTAVAAGQGRMRVGAIGEDTKMGAIAVQVQEPEEETPFQRQLKIFGRQLVVVVGILVVGVFGLGVVYGQSLTEIFVTAVALAVSSIPEGLIVALTVVLVIGMQRILRRRGLVKRLAAAETLGGVTVICVDKTGTLTQGKMKVVEAVGDREKLAQQAILANDLDDPIVVAAFEWGRKTVSDFVADHPRLDSIPFSPKERWFMSLNRWRGGKNMIFVNGAPEVLVERSTLDSKEKSRVREEIESLTAQGRRLIGMARKEAESTKKRVEEGDAVELEWVGLLAFSDPIRVGVKEALEQAMTAGIKVMVITGDYSKTSEFVLAELGMRVRKEEVMTGQELERLGVEDLARRVKTTRLFARTTPAQKLSIVEALKKNGEVVAMMGDGVNDAPALHRADVGIVVGEATDVARESADLVLLDSNFSTIVAAVEEGRVIFENIRKIVVYLLSDAFGEILVVIGSLVAGWPLPLTAGQILWINLVSDGFPSLALTVDPKRAGIMREKPRLAGELLVSRWMLGLIALVSVAAGMVALAAFGVVYKVTGDIILARSMAFLTLGLNSLAYVFSVRVLTVPFWRNHLWENKWLVAAVAAGGVLQYLPFATDYGRRFFGVVSLGWEYWLVAAGLSVLMFLVIEVFKAWKRSK